MWTSWNLCWWYTPFSETSISYQTDSILPHIYIYTYIWLVVSTPLKNMKASWDYYSQYIETCSKPPTTYIYIYIVNPRLSLGYSPWCPQIIYVLLSTFQRFKGSGLTLLSFDRRPAVSGLEPWANDVETFGCCWSLFTCGYVIYIVASYPFAPPTST